jgi:hypothetical protein
MLLLIGVNELSSFFTIKVDKILVVVGRTLQLLHTSKCKRCKINKNHLDRISFPSTLRFSSFSTQTHNTTLRVPKFFPMESDERNVSLKGAKEFFCSDGGGKKRREEKREILYEVRNLRQAHGDILR